MFAISQTRLKKGHVVAGDQRQRLCQPRQSPQVSRRRADDLDDDGDMDLVSASSTNDHTVVGQGAEELGYQGDGQTTDGFVAESRLYYKA